VNKRLILCSVLVAVVGLSSALLIYRTASDDNDSVENVQTIVVDGNTYRIPLASTKMYRRDVQRFGGGAAVLADDLDRWFAGLWHGRSLAVTLTWITAFVSIGLFLLARQMPSDQNPGDDHDPE
jgi:hypothetical protein